MWIWMIQGVQPAPGWVNSAEPKSVMARDAPRRGPYFPRSVEHAKRSISQGLLGNRLLTDKLLRHHRGVVSAEAEGVVQSSGDRHFARLVWHVVEIALRIRILVVDRRRDEICLNRLGADGHFDGAGGAEHVSGGALGGADGQFSRAVAEDGLDRLRFADVSLRRR